MKIDLLLDVAEPTSSAHARAADHEATCLELITAADDAGFGCVWAFAAASRMGATSTLAPEILLSAAAAATERIAIGCGLAMQNGPLNHPIRVAEQIATLDIVSGGRVEWGIAHDESVEGFSDLDTDSNEESLASSPWAEALAMIPRMWAPGKKFSHEGKHFSIPEREILPKPLQDPHPRVWLGTRSAAAGRLAARSGVGLLDLEVARSLDELTRFISGYRRAADDRVADRSNAGVNQEVGAIAFAHCDDAGEEQTRREALESGRETFGARAEERGVVGSADACIDKLESYREAGCDRVLLLMRPSRIRHQALLRSIESLGSAVIPYFDRD